MSGSWRDEAECKGMPPHIFVPDNKTDAARAKLICSRCTVTSPCLEEAIAEGHIGVWGGMADDERHAYVHTRRVTVR